MTDRDDFKPTEPFSTEAEALATAIYEDHVNSWFEAKRMLVAALHEAYERGKKDARNATLEEAWAAVAQALCNDTQAVQRRARNAIRAMKQESGE